jgi:hypothetical protein
VVSDLSHQGRHVKAQAASRMSQSKKLSSAASQILTSWNPLTHRLRILDALQGVA